MDLIQKIKELNFPKGQYVVVGSGVLDILGIRKASDIDIVVTKDLHQKLRESGEWEEDERYGKIFLKKDIYEIIPQLNWEKYNTTTEEAIASALIIEDTPYMNLYELIKFKTALGREKDAKDIELINEYLDNKTEKRVRSIIIKDKKVLLIHRIKQGDEYFVFPGGGVDDTDNSLEDGLKRECLEELGTTIEIVDLFMKKFYVLDNFQGQVQYFYNCNIVSGKVGTGTGPEWSGRDIEKYGTYELVWIPMSELKDKIIYPFEARDKIINVFSIM
ncbi:MAG: NUDIX domain-containing protein [Candidatus Nomurabacteria bacterium]